MSEQTPVTISAIALNNTDSSVLKVAATLLEKQAIPVQLLEGTDTSGTIIVVDIDTPAGRDFYDHFDNPRQRIMLLLSSDTINDPRNPVIKKPIRVQTLRDVLIDICTGLAPKAKQAMSAEEKTKTIPLSPPTDPNNSLFFLLLKAKQEKQVLQIFCSPYSPLFIDTSKEIVATSASRDTLRKIIQTSSGQLRSTKISSQDFEVLARGQLMIPLNHLLWSAALYGSFGQLIPKHSPDIPVQLKAWPNLSRLEFETDHMKLASIMAARAMTLKQVQEKFHISWDTLVGFYNAAWATGLLTVNPANLPTVSVKKVADKTGLFAKIANRLRLAH
jgi:hypothetical protein